MDPLIAQLLSFRPELQPDPVLDQQAIQILEKAKLRGQLPQPGPLSLPSYETAKVCCLGGNFTPALAFRKFKGGSRTLGVLKDRNMTCCGTASLAGPRNGILWSIILGKPETIVRDPAPDPADSILEALVTLHNIERTKFGLDSLQIHPSLLEAARSHACDMAAHHVLGHNGSDWSDVALRVTRAGYPPFSFVGENVATGQQTPDELMRSWLASPKHRANILGASYVHFGGAMVRDVQGVPWWVTVFGTPLGVRMDVPRLSYPGINTPPTLTNLP